VLLQQCPQPRGSSTYIHDYAVAIIWSIVINLLSLESFLLYCYSIFHSPCNLRVKGPTTAHVHGTGIQCIQKLQLWLFFVHARTSRSSQIARTVKSTVVLWGRRERQDHVHFILYDVILLHGTFVLTMHPGKHLPLSQLLIGHYAPEEV